MSQSRVYVGYCSICKVKVPLPSETRFHQSGQKHSNSGVGDGFLWSMSSLCLLLKPQSYEKARKGRDYSSVQGAGAGAIAALVQCLPPMHKALGLILQSIQLGMVAHICNPSKEGQELKVILGHTEFKTTLCYVRHCLKKIKKTFI